MATFKSRLGIPESYTTFDVVVFYFEHLLYGTFYALAYGAVAVGVLTIFYLIAYMPLAWAIGHLLGLVSR